MANHIRKFHLDKREAKWLGVCAGIADYTGVDATIIRVATVLAVLLSSGLFLVAYLIIALIAKPRSSGA